LTVLPAPLTVTYAPLTRQAPLSSVTNENAITTVHAAAGITRGAL
jgi:hypothetical protein